VTVFLTGTQTKATIFSSPSGAPLSNPFTANASTSPDPGGWIFWAAQGAAYDIVMSGGIAPNVYPNPITLTGVALGSAVGGSEPANTALMAPSNGPGAASFRTFTPQDIAQAHKKYGKPRWNTYAHTNNRRFPSAPNLAIFHTRTVADRKRERSQKGRGSIVAEEPKTERSVEEQVAEILTDKAHREKFLRLIGEMNVDDEALIVLKGHLVLEERLDAIFEKFVFNPDHLETARLTFAQKLAIARSISLDQDKNPL
jgi:hypothetical protein